MTHDPIPIVCSLPTAEAASQVMKWNDLGRHASTIEHLDGGFAATFPMEVADSVEDLAAREAACCGFLSITTTRADQEVRLEITSDNGDARPVMEALARAIGI